MPGHSQLLACADSNERQVRTSRSCAPGSLDTLEVVAAHVRCLEALQRAGIVERVAEGLWKAGRAARAGPPLRRVAPGRRGRVAEISTCPSSGTRA